MQQIIDLCVIACVLVAGGLSLSAGIGLLRFRDPLTRLHAATKPQIFGLLLMLVALALSQRSLLVLFALLPVFILQSLTAPVSAHMAGRAAYRAGHIDRENLVQDELDGVIAATNSQVVDPHFTDLSAEESATLAHGTQTEKINVHRGAN